MCANRMPAIVQVFHPSRSPYHAIRSARELELRPKPHLHLPPAPARMLRRKCALRLYRKVVQE